MALDPKWMKTVEDGITNPAWDDYDAILQAEVAAYNTKFLSTAQSTGYKLVDWHICKAILWVESGGPKSPAWNARVMQIGNPGDPAIKVLRQSAEGSLLVMGSQLATLVKTGNINDPALNIRAAIAYLFTRMAEVDYKSVVNSNDPTVYTYTVVAGDTLDQIAARVGTTVSELTAKNPTKVNVIYPKDVLTYRKATMQRKIVGWTDFTTTNIANHYNGGGDPNYAAKLNFVLDLFKKLKRSPQKSGTSDSAPNGDMPTDPVTTIPILP